MIPAWASAASIAPPAVLTEKRGAIGTCCGPVGRVKVQTLSACERSKPMQACRPRSSGDIGMPWAALTLVIYITIFGASFVNAIGKIGRAHV